MHACCLLALYSKFLDYSFKNDFPFFLLYLGDFLTKTMLSCLDLLEALCRCLDKEYKYGQCKCWKHLAEFFGISEDEYQKFEYQQILSPTELMFEYLQSTDPDLTIGGLKDGLRQIERLDVISILIKHEKCEYIKI